jgi:hypothetical protein
MGFIHHRVTKAQRLARNRHALFLRGSAVMHPPAAPQRGRMASVSAHQAGLVTEPSLSLDDCLKSQSNRSFPFGRYCQTVVLVSSCWFCPTARPSSLPGFTPQRSVPASQRPAVMQSYSRTFQLPPSGQRLFFCVSERSCGISNSFVNGISFTLKGMQKGNGLFPQCRMKQEPQKGTSLFRKWNKLVLKIWCPC